MSYMDLVKQTQNVMELLAELKLKAWSNILVKDLEEMPAKEKIFIIGHLSKYLLLERTERRNQLIASRIKPAKFKKVQTVENFDFKHSKTTQKIEKTYLSMYEGLARDNLPSAVFSGNAGTGKTHLARAIGYAACQKGLSSLFITAAEMVNHLAHAQKTYNLEAELNKYRRPLVLIIDELGYVSLDTQASNLFFQVISSPLTMLTIHC